MDWKRIGLSLCSFLVIIALLISWSPIKAKAVAVEASIAIGLIAMLILASAGVVYTANTTSQIQAIGNSFQTHMYQWGTSAEKLDEVESFFSGLQLYDPGSGDDDETPHEKQVRLARGILAGITAWVASLALGNIEIRDEATAPDGYVYYNGYLLPEIIGSANKYKTIFITSDGTINHFCRSTKLSIQRTTDGLFYFASAPGSGPRFKLIDGVWESQGVYGSIDASEGYLSQGAKIIWANYDVVYFDNNSLYLAASEPSSVLNELIEPNIYVGDIPDQLQSGELEPEAIPLPDINLEPYILDGKLAYERVTDAMNQLATGALPYAQFLEQSTVAPQPEPEPEPEPDPEPITGTFADTAVGTFIDSLIDALMAPFEWLANALLEGIKAIFVPHEDFLTDKVDALRSEFSFADSIISTFELFGNSLLAFSTSPPVIYVDLGASTGSYYLGGKVPFVDLTWYAAYKPTVDLLLSAFMWLVFVWRVGIHLPGIIRGSSGDVPGGIVPSGTEKSLIVKR